MPGEAIKQPKTVDVSNLAFLVSRPETIQRDEIVYELFQSFGKFAKLRALAIPLDGINRAMYVDNDLLEKTIRYLAELVSTREGYQKHLADFEKLKVSYAQMGEEFLSLGTDKAVLAIAYQKFIAAVQGLSNFAWMPFAIDKVLGPKLLLLLERDFGGEAMKIHSIVSSPTKLNAFQQMRLQICDSVIDQVPLEQAVEKLVEKYHWYNEYSFVEELCDGKFFEKEMKALNADTAQYEKKGILSENETNRELFSQIRGLIADQETSLLADVVNEYTYLRAERIDLLKKLQVSTRHLFTLIADNLIRDTEEKWMLEDVARLLSREISDYLSGGVLPVHETVHGRTQVVYYRDSEKSEIIADPDMVAEIVAKLQAPESKIVTGAVAFKGKVQGRVVMVLSKQDLPKVTAGSVLVARTTMPDYTAAMKIAGAFVTEEGGITSHAAIIARELKTPCIVGTGNCTRVLHDGDEVEVDADKGIVKILKTNNV